MILNGCLISNYFSFNSTDGNIYAVTETEGAGTINATPDQIELILSSLPEHQQQESLTPSAQEEEQEVVVLELNKLIDNFTCPQAINGIAEHLETQEKPLEPTPFAKLLLEAPVAEVRKNRKQLKQIARKASGTPPFPTEIVGLSFNALYKLV